MEDLNNKLNSSNSITRTRIVSRLVQNIQDKYDKNPDLWEMRFLREHCLNTNPAINELINDAILHLIKIGVIDIKPILADFITVITTTSFPPNFVYLINQLLIIDMKQELSNKSDYKSPFNLCLPQHPFITILNENSDSWCKIYNEIVLNYQTVDKELLVYLNELYKPLFVAVICDPCRNNQNLIIFKQQLWAFLVNNQTIWECKIIEDIMKWLQINSINSIEATSRLLIEMSTIIDKYRYFNPQLLILLEISSLHYLVLNNHDPRTLISQIIKLVENSNVAQIIDVCLLLISKTIPICSSVYLSQLLTLTQLLLHRQPTTNPIVKQIIKSSLLQWVSNSSILINDSIDIIRKLLEFINDNQTKTTNNYKKLLNFWQKEKYVLRTINEEIYLSTRFCLIINNWRNNQDLLDWLRKLEESPKYFLVKIMNLLYGLFLCRFNDNDEINLRIFDILIKCSADCKRINQELLTIILYKLTNCVNSQLHLKLLKQLPRMANLKDNYTKVLNTIHALTKTTTNNHLICFSIELMFDLWQIDNKSTYPHLENLLINTKLNDWEFLIIKSRILTDLCELKPELHGKDMVAHLSKILNDCNDDKHEIACSTALQGIRHLCKIEIIDAITTWSNLQPIFRNDQRKLVIKSLCDLISECPQLSYIEAYQHFLDDLLKVLWDYLLKYPDADIWGYALNAMITFNIDQMTAQMPQIYGNDDDDDGGSDKHQSGQCWIRFLKKSPKSLLPIIGDFFIKLINIEITNYLKYVYQIKGVREPIDYSYLPTNSLVRIIGWFLKVKASKFELINPQERLIIRELLRVFSQEYPKPLPPLDWCFLQEFIHESDLKDFCIKIAAHQVILSGTARRLIENYLIALTENKTNDDDAIQIYRNLKHIANSIQPIVLKPFLQITLLTSTESFKNNGHPIFIEIVDCLKDTLDDKTIQDINKTVIAETISVLIAELTVDSPLFELLLNCITKFPQKQLDLLISTKTVRQLNTDWLIKAIRIRCALAANTQTSPLNYLNELIEVCYEFPTLTPLIYGEFVKVFKKHRHNTESALWYLDFLGQIQALIADKGNQQQIVYQCNILILSTIIFSGHFVFMDNLITDVQHLFDLFPQAIVALLDINHWSICTTMALEWLHFMYKNENFTNEYKDIFKQSLQALRHDHEFTKNMNWMKYINVEF